MRKPLPAEIALAAACVFAAAAAALQRSPVVVVLDGLAIAEYRRGRWIAAEPALSQSGVLRFSQVSLGRRGPAAFNARLMESPGNGGIVVSSHGGVRGAFISGSKPAFRPVIPAPDALRRHRAAVRAALRERGVGGRGTAERPSCRPRWRRAARDGAGGLLPC